jgi:hypothetical protein
LYAEVEERGDEREEAGYKFRAGLVKGCKWLYAEVEERGDEREEADYKFTAGLDLTRAKKKLCER